MNSTNPLSIVAIILATIALIVSFIAMNRTSEENLQPIVEEQVEMTLQQLLGAPAPAPEPGPAPAPGAEEEEFQQEEDEATGPEEPQAF